MTPRGPEQRGPGCLNRGMAHFWIRAEHRPTERRTPVVAEDAAAISLSLVAVFAPLFVPVLLVVLPWIGWSLWRRFKRLTGRRRPEPEYVPLSS